MERNGAIIAISTIATFRLRVRCDYRKYAATMDIADINPTSLDGTRAAVVLDHFGGTVAVARLTRTPNTTVHGWRRVGMSEARFDHLQLAAVARGKSGELASALQALAELDGDPELPFEAGEQP